MKTFSLLILSMLVLWSLSSCEHKIITETVVHEDGSLEKTIILEKSDSATIRNNFFGISQEKGWELTVESDSSSESGSSNSNKDKLILTFTKKFESAKAANEALSTSSDTLIGIRSDFETRFRWFYTYLKYSDTYKAMNRFGYASPDDFITQEDYAFIDRLPPEGSRISSADSLYLKMLEDKVYEHYAGRAIIEENFHILDELIKRNQLDDRWLDTVNVYKMYFYHVAKEDTSTNMDDFAKEGFILKIADSLHIPLPYQQIQDDYHALWKTYKMKIDFMTYVSDGKYTNIIQMPGTILTTNADSIAGTTAFWHPPVIKFMLKDYTMYAETRKINYWALAVSALIIVLTGFVLARRRRA